MPAARRSTEKESLAGAAGERVRAIIEAAESSAAAIRAEAEAEAERIRTRAEERASTLRSEVRGDVAALIGAIREGVDRLRADLERLERRLADEPAETAAPAAEPMETAAPAAELAERAAPAAEPGEPPLAEDLAIALAADAAVDLDEGDPAPAAGDADVEGARLVALNLALDGAPRAEVNRHLRENFKLADPDALLDEVYESIGRS